MLQLWINRAVGIVDKTFCFISAFYYVRCSDGDVSALILSHKILGVQINTTGQTSFAHTVVTMVETLACLSSPQAPSSMTGRAPGVKTKRQELTFRTKLTFLCTLNDIKSYSVTHMLFFVTYTKQKKTGPAPPAGVGGGGAPPGEALLQCYSPMTPRPSPGACRGS
jgi:hypothetical protein